VRVAGGLRFGQLPGRRRGEHHASDQRRHGEAFDDGERAAIDRFLAGGPALTDVDVVSALAGGRHVRVVGLRRSCPWRLRRRRMDAGADRRAMRGNGLALIGGRTRVDILA
jgi:hypothetical protein